MSVMVDSITDWYPMETASFDNLPQESPISYLDYGGTLTQIGELVKEKRKENRVKRREFLIKKINIVNLDILVDKIQEEAEDLESYRAKQWKIFSITKANVLKFFLSHDIPLQYLEDMYILQSKGMPVVKKKSLIEIKRHKMKTEYGVVVKERQKGKSIVEYIIVDKNLQPTYYDLEYHKINIWKCKVVGEFTEENWEIYNRLVAKYNKDMRHRSEYWNNHPVLSSHNTPYGYYDQGYDVMNGDVPLSETYSCLDKKYINDRPIWKIFKGCIDEKLRLERENQ
tara:strand:+ start:577 stop:1425 length:849 start_codon:yes stop_codon:yes gene_type:complete